MDDSQNEVWYYVEGAEQKGPVSTEQLKELAQTGAINQQTKVWKKGITEWVPAHRLKGLFVDYPSAVPPPLPEPNPQREQLEQNGNHQFIDKTTAIVKDALSELQNKDFWEIVNPFRKENLFGIKTDSSTWVIVILGVAPLLIGTLKQENHQLFTFALFFAAFWAVIFTKFIVKPDKIKWTILASTLFFTGIVGIYIYQLIYQLLPTSLMGSPASTHATVRFLGSIFVTGFSEEICKAFPVVVGAFMFRKSIEPKTIILMGVFSGLGFAAFENIMYGDVAIVNSLKMTIEGGAPGFVSGVRSAMVLAMLRSISLVFCHALWSGIVAFYCTRKTTGVIQSAAALSIGVAISSLMHGTYNWLQTIQPTFATLVVTLSFLMFYSCINQVNSDAAESIQNEAKQ